MSKRPTPGATAPAENAAAGPAPLPPAVTEHLLASSDAIARRLARRLVAEISLPEGFRTRAYLRLVAQASHDGLHALLRQLHDGRRPHPAELAALGLAGAHQAEMGVPLEVLLRGYRVAAKVVWREVVDEAARRGGLSPATVVALSDQVLEYLDEISGAVGSAYLETRERLLRHRDRERDILLRRVLAGDASPGVLRVASTLGLELTPPYRLLACAVAPGVDADAVLGQAWRRAGAVLVADEAGTWAALVSPTAPVDALVRDGLAAARAAASADGAPPLVVGVGPVAPTLDAVADAAARARRALAVGRRLRPHDALHDEREVAVFAALDDDPDAMRRHVEHALGPLLDGTVRHRDLLATLTTVLESRGVAEAAAVLGVHRHTVVYRVQRVSDRLGVDLEDPGERHRLWLALRCARLLDLA